MFGITDLGLFVAGTIAIVLLPGPNSLYVLTVAARNGIRAGYAGALGVFFGDTTLMLLTALGAASVLHAYPLLFAGVRLIGAAYLGYLGIRLLLAAWRAVREVRDGGAAEAVRRVADTALVAEHSAVAIGRKAYVISLLNPKAILFFLSFFVQFVDTSYPHPALTFLALGTIVQMISLLYLSAIVFGGARLAQAFAGRKRLSAFLNSTVGLLFIAFGVKLAS
ncbi:leucine efflux protein LeuE [Chitinimonas sp.]|uniref:leucine efflux protein LeuE n=1 Tax=Chitinimonas sp. TaxID=1934313 RepID=UPI002F93139F